MMSAKINFFVGKAQKMVKKFAETKTFVIFASSSPCWKPSWVGCLGRHIYIKGVTVRFGFDCVEFSQSSTISQEQSNGNAPWVYCIHSFQDAVSISMDGLYLMGWLYIHLRGAFSVARFDLSGNARSLTQWNEWQSGSTFLFCVWMF